MIDSPTEYIERLRAENRVLRYSLIEVVREKQLLEETVARQSANMLQLLKQLPDE